MDTPTSTTQEGTQPGRESETFRQHLERLRILREMDRAILEAHSLEEIARVALQQLRRLVPCRRTSVAVFDPEAAEVTLIAVDTHGDTEAGAGTRLSPEPFGDIIQTLWRGEVYVAEDMRAIPQDLPVVQALRAEGCRSLTIVPLIFHGEPTGSLNLLAAAPHAFSPEHIEIAQEVANQLAIAIGQARLHEQVRAGRERLHTLSRRLLEAQESERRRIARELHDQIGQALTAVKINLQTIQRLPDPASSAAYLEESIETVERALQQVRNLSLDLRPSLLDDLGLVAALRWYVDRQAQRAGFSAQFTADPFDARLPTEVETTCFRVAQEALTNIVRHSRARRVKVELRHSETELQLLIRDDGAGFDVQAALDSSMRGASLGLLGMRERVHLVGGKIEIESSPAAGTEIRVRLPLTASPLERRTPGRATR